MSEQHPKQETQIQINIDEKIADGIYSNLTISNFNLEEFVLDFAFIQPHVKKGQIKSRVIMSPRNAKKLSEMLKKNIQDYESKMGSIDRDPSVQTGINLSSN